MRTKLGIKKKPLISCLLSMPGKIDRSGNQILPEDKPVNICHRNDIT